MSEFATLRPQHTHSGSEVIASGAANECPICLAKELAEAKRTNERLVELLWEGYITFGAGIGDRFVWRNYIRKEFRRLGLSL